MDEITQKIGFLLAQIGDLTVAIEDAKGRRAGLIQQLSALQQTLAMLNEKKETPTDGTSTNEDTKFGDSGL